VGALLLHVPPMAVLASAIVWPWHTTPAPVIEGAAPTLIVAVTAQPDESVLVMTALPGAVPVTMPVSEPTAATAVLLLLHVALPPLLVSVVAVPVHTVRAPLITGMSTVTLPCGPQQPAADIALK
jgi:hypothetical protein